MGHQSVFVTCDGQGNGVDFLKSKNIDVLVIKGSPGDLVDEEQDAENVLQAIGSRTFDVVVVDHYQLSAQWESIVKEKIPRVMAIDDLDRKHHCDDLIDPNG